MSSWAARVVVVLALAAAHVAVAPHASAQAALDPEFKPLSPPQLPSRKLPLTLFVPGAAAIIAATVAYGVWRTDNDWSQAQERASKGLLGAGGALLVGSAFWWGALSAQRKRLEDDQAVAKCAEYPASCTINTAREPSRFTFLYMAVPGLALLAGGAAAYAIGMAEQREADRDPWGEPVNVGIWPGGIVLITLGGTFIAGSLLILNKSMRNHRRWDHARQALASVRLGPMMRVSSLDKRSPGIGLSARF